MVVVCVFSRYSCKVESLQEFGPTSISSSIMV
jgi:hypothetical protein